MLAQRPTVNRWAAASARSTSAEGRSGRSRWSVHAASAMMLLCRRGGCENVAVADRSDGQAHRDLLAILDDDRQGWALAGSVLENGRIVDFELIYINEAGARPLPPNPAGHAGGRPLPPLPAA